jgi:hypothetical protein
MMIDRTQLCQLRLPTKDSCGEVVIILNCTLSKVTDKSDNILKTPFALVPGLALAAMPDNFKGAEIFRMRNGGIIHKKSVGVILCPDKTFPLVLHLKESKRFQSTDGKVWTLNNETYVCANELRENVFNLRDSSNTIFEACSLTRFDAGFVMTFLNSLCPSCRGTKQISLFTSVKPCPDCQS